MKTTKRPPITFIGPEPLPPGQRPRCCNCGKELRPALVHVEKMVEEVKRLPYSTEDAATVTDLPCHAQSGAFLGEDGEWYSRSRWLNHTDDGQRRWLGYYGVDNNSLFCTLRCGYSYGVRVARGE